MKAAFVDPRPSAFAELDRLYRAALRLCDRLEAVADSLPYPDRTRCRRLAAMLRPCVESANSKEEQLLFPALIDRLPRRAGTDMVARLREEHARDRVATDEIVQLLLELSRGHPVSWNATGYRLRAHFLSVRRHIASEQDLMRAVAECEP